MPGAARIPEAQKARMERFFAAWSERQIRLTTILWGMAGATSCFNAVVHRAPEAKVLWGISTVVWILPLLYFRLKVDRYRRIREAVEGETPDEGSRGDE